MKQLTLFALLVIVGCKEKKATRVNVVDVDVYSDTIRVEVSGSNMVRSSSLGFGRLLVRYDNVTTYITILPKPQQHGTGWSLAIDTTHAN